MTHLLITDIRKSISDSSFDLVTAIIISAEGRKELQSISNSSKENSGLLILESATADKAMPVIGVKEGDQFLRIWARPDHGLKVGVEIRLDDIG